MSRQAFTEETKQSNQENSKENISLFQAASRGSLSEVQQQLRNGAKPNFFFNPEDNKNALHIAAEKGHTDIVKVLLEHGAAVNCTSTTDHLTALILAADCKNPATTKLLLESGANVNAANCYGNTALHSAAHSGNFEVAKLLLAAGAAVNHQNKKGSTPLHTLCYGELADHSVQFVKLLLDHGADANCKDQRGTTPLLVCCCSGRADLADCLLAAGADEKVKDQTGHSCADVARFYQHESMAKRFA